MQILIHSGKCYDMTRSICTKPYIPSRYYLKIQRVKRQVCKRNFEDTFKISEAMVKTVQQKLLQGLNFVQELRGKHDQHRTTPLAVSQLMQAHIQAFPHYNVHYSRAKLNQFYLSSDLTIDRMFQDFARLHPHVFEVGRKESLYRKLFRDSNLRIGEPRTDTCKQCDTNNISLRSARRDNNLARIDAALQERDLHLLMVEDSGASLRADLLRSRADFNFVVLCGDLQQVYYKTFISSNAFKLFF
jgi:hypothetical protein